MILAACLLAVVSSKAQTSGDSTVTGNLDVIGNSFSLGQWLSDSATPGFSATFTDSATTDLVPVWSSSIGFSQPRALSSWLWSHGVEGEATSMSMMRLDSLNKLGLFDPYANTTPTLLLDPASSGTSQFPGNFVANGTVNQLPYQTLNGNDGSIILTRTLGDSLYARNTLGAGVLTDSFNSTAFGRFNVGAGSSGSSSAWVDSDPLFELGNGTSASVRSNAVTVRKDGETTLQNTGFDAANPEKTNVQALQVNGSSSFQGTVSVAGSTTLNGAVTIGGKTIVQGTLIISTPAGGILMGEFTNPVGD